MAAEGKRLPLTFKVLACLAAGILVTWVVTTLLDTYFNMPLLADTKGWLLRAGDWLLLETPMPNWSLMLIIATLIGTLSVAIYYTRSPDGAGGELHEIERKVYKKNNPQFPQLTENQTLLMEVLAYHANYRKIASLDSVCKLVSISTLEVEVGLKQLEAKRLVKRSATRGTFGATTFSLTVAGKDYALERFELT